MKLARKRTFYSTEAFMKIDNLHTAPPFYEDLCTFGDIFEAHEKVWLGGGEVQVQCKKGGCGE